MAGPVRSFIPHAFVKDVPASIAFYRKLGFTVGNSFTPEGAVAPDWCWLSSEKGDLMLGTAREPIEPAQQRVLFYGYCDDVASTHAELVEAGMEVARSPNHFTTRGASSN